MGVADTWVRTPWHGALELDAAVMRDLDRFVAAERADALVLPPDRDVFRAFDLVAPEAVRVVLLGQDPYPTPGHAHGLAFSYQGQGTRPRSLSNVFKELEADLGIRVPAGTHDLTPWARQGVLLLNTVLTVRAGEAGAHRRRGWEALTEAVVRYLAERPTPIVFLLWGGEARKRKQGVVAPHHVLEAGHPSPLSFRHFSGCRHFSKANALLGDRAIDWRL